MKLFKTLLVQCLFSFNALIASSESSSVHIAVLEDSTLIEKTPFHARVHVYVPSPLETDKEFQEHGVSVCSVLVGEHSTLPKDTPITLVPDLKAFQKYLETRSSQDLVILNWSGCTGYPGLSEEVLENLEDLSQHFKSIVTMEKSQFNDHVQDYVGAYEGILAQIPEDNVCSVVLTYAKSCLMEARQQPDLLDERRDHYQSGFAEKINSYKKYAQERATVKFDEMKEDVLQCLTKHDNTLIVWALGNDGECIDQDPFWHGVLSEKNILDHTLLVQGNQRSGRKSVESNFTVSFKDHCVGKPYRCPVWSAPNSCYLLKSGTSFSAPLVTIDGFLKAKEILTQTGEMPRYDALKRALLMG